MEWKRSKRLLSYMAAAIFVMVNMGILYAENPIGGEKKPILDPLLFKGKTAYTYQIAREIPEVLDNIYCYCRCQNHSGHKSLLSCYTDKHAAFCDVCQNQAIRAYELYKEGKDIATIKKIEDEEFGR